MIVMMCVPLPLTLTHFVPAPSANFYVAMGEMVQCSYCILLWLRCHFVSCMNPMQGDGDVWRYTRRLS